MQQYWINQDGVQAGPVTIEQMEKMSITGKAYVWRSGLEDWVKITELPELAGVWQSPTQNVPPVPPVPPVDQATPPAIPVAEPATEEPQPVAEAEPEAEPTADLEPEQTAEPATDAGDNDAQTVPLPPEIPQEYSSYQPQPAGSQEFEECPPSNLVWAIISALLCQPLGIIAIILSVMVKNNYRDGNIKRAKQFSEWSAWCCILAITFGVASCLILPLEFLL